MVPRESFGYLIAESVRQSYPGRTAVELGGVNMQITIREPGSALTHFIGMMMAVFAAMPLLVKAATSGGNVTLTAMTVFTFAALRRQRHLPQREPHRFPAEVFQKN